MFRLKNHFYYGVFKFNNEVYQGSHEPIISKKLFDSVQQAMNNRGKKKRKRKHEFAFSGLMRCGNCGCLITAEKQKGHNYYRCTKKKQKCDEKYLREENLVEQMRDFIQKVSLPDDWAENMLLELDKEKEQAKKESEVFVQNLQQQKAEVGQKIEKLLDLYITGGALTLEEYQAKNQNCSTKSWILSRKLEILNNKEIIGSNR